jgi:acyl-CoA reductase-like NAD-dependent aldehyde dehydrogenase
VTVMIIDARPVIGTRSFDVVNPATGTAFAQAPHCSDEQLDESVAAAARAFPAWSENVESRRVALVTAADLLQRRAGEIVALLTAEPGKPLAMARAELDGSVAALRSLAQAALPRQVIRDDVDLDAATEPLFWASFINPGQVCAAAKRVYAPSDRYDKVVEATLPLPFAPFGGRDWSGIGVEGGRWGLEAFIDWHTVYTARAGAPVTELSETVP